MEAKGGEKSRARLRSERRHQAVANLGQLALEGCPPKRLLDRAVLEVGRCLDTRFVKLLELTPEGSGLKLRAGIGWHSGLVGHAIVPADAGSQAGFTLLSEETVVVRDSRTEQRFAPPQLLSDHGIICGASVIVGPLSDPWGVLGVHESELGRCAFDCDDIDFIRSVANIIWLFIRNLRSRRETERERKALRSFADAMPILFAVVNQEGRYDFVNKAYWAFGREPCSIVGQHVMDVVGPEAYAQVEPHARQAMSGNVVNFENSVPFEGEQREMLATFAPRRGMDGAVNGYYAAVVDITDQKRRQREALERSQQYRAIADSIPYGIWTCDPEGRLTYVSDSFLDLVGMSFDQAESFGWISKLLPEEAEETRQAWQKCVSEHGNWEREHRFIGRDGNHYHILAIARPVFDEDGGIFGYVGLNLDITERKKREETLALVSSELDHRVKNVFSLVLSIARQASLSAINVDAFRDAFESRIKALSTAHQLIAESRWQDMSFKALVEAELEPYRGTDRCRWTVEGPDLTLPVGSVQILALAFHELATNAAKHGAFSGPSGTVSVQWKLLQNGSLRIYWTEEGLDGVTEPRKAGFGSRVLKQVLVMQLGADVDMAFQSNGLRVEIVLPLENMRGV